MKITKDILKALNIETVFIQKDAILYICLPLKIENDYWMIATETNNLPNDFFLKINYNSQVIRIKGEIDSFIEEPEFHAFVYKIKIHYDENSADENQKKLFLQIKELEKKQLEWNKRSEERFSIGTDKNKIEAFKLKEIEQTIIMDNVQLPCILNNVSYSGAKITTFESDFCIDKKIILVFSFVEPIEQIQLLATIKHASLKILPNNQTISTLSLQYDTFSLQYKERLTQYIEELKA